MYDVTFDGLHCWNKAIFEKLGWMVLVHSQGQSKAVTDCYMVEINNLKGAVGDKITKMTEMNCMDKVEDLNIMLRNLDILLNHVEKDFKNKSNVNNKKNNNKINNNQNISSINQASNNEHNLNMTENNKSFLLGGKLKKNKNNKNKNNNKK